jgi:exosortase
MISSTVERSTRRVRSLVALAAVLASLSWAYWPTLHALAVRWSHDPQYSHGFLVPLFAEFLLWSRRHMLAASAREPSWWGLALLVLGAAGHLLGAYVYIDCVDAASLLLCLAGAAVLSGGFGALRWVAPAIGFLSFMIPLPYRLEIAAAHPLQRIATLASTYMLQVLGISALAEGNIILLDEMEIGVAEACSGLRMLMVFFALAVAVALVIERKHWERLVLVASAVPIAMASNVLRITVAGVLHDTVGSDWANRFFHDLGGWLMMPVALGMMWLVLQLLSRLFVVPGAPARPRISLATGRPRPIAVAAVQPAAR